MVRTPHTKKELKEFHKYESKKYGFKKAKRPFFEIGEKRVLWKYVYTLRCAEYHMNAQNRFHYLIWKFLLRRLQTKYSIIIPENVCGKGLKIMHLGNILINGNAKIGENCSIHVSSAVVASGIEGYTPSIGNDVVIGVGAILLGNITIPDGCIIGANALVNKSFDEKSIAIAGNPAKKISNNGQFTRDRREQADGKL